MFPKWGVEYDDVLDGYVNYDVGPGGLWVTEACAGTRPSYDAIARIVAHASGSAGCDTIRGSLPHDHPLVPCIEEVLNGTAVWTGHDEMMTKLVDWKELRKKLLDVGFGVPEEAPVGRSETDAFWRVLLGVPTEPDRETLWWECLGECPPAFYWWTDIF